MDEELESSVLLPEKNLTFSSYPIGLHSIAADSIEPDTLTRALTIRPETFTAADQRHTRLQEGQAFLLYWIP